MAELARVDFSAARHLPQRLSRFRPDFVGNAAPLSVASSWCAWQGGGEFRRRFAVAEGRRQRRGVELCGEFVEPEEGVLVQTPEALLAAGDQARWIIQRSSLAPKVACGDYALQIASPRGEPDEQGVSAGA
jgi:hypothetical protein